MALARKTSAKISNKKPAKPKAAPKEIVAPAPEVAQPAAPAAATPSTESKSRQHRHALVKKTGQKPRVAKQPSITGGGYIVELDVNEEKYDADGTTAVEAITNLAAQFPNFFVLKTRAVLSLSKDGKTASMIFFAIQLRRLLKSSTARDVWAKRLEIMMK